MMPSSHGAAVEPLQTSAKQQPQQQPGCNDAAAAAPGSIKRLRGGRGAAAHPRVAILGLLEARLQSFDRVVLGALEETVWPQATDPGPWMSRAMRKQFGLPEPEARIGRVASVRPSMPGM